MLQIRSLLHLKTRRLEPSPHIRSGANQEYRKPRRTVASAVCADQPSARTSAGGGASSPSRRRARRLPRPPQRVCSRPLGAVTRPQRLPRLLSQACDRALPLSTTASRAEHQTPSSVVAKRARALAAGGAATTWTARCRLAHSMPPSKVQPARIRRRYAHTALSDDLLSASRLPMRLARHLALASSSTNPMKRLLPSGSRHQWARSCCRAGATVDAWSSRIPRTQLGHRKRPPRPTRARSLSLASRWSASGRERRSIGLDLITFSNSCVPSCHFSLAPRMISHLTWKAEPTARR